MDREYVTFQIRADNTFHLCVAISLALLAWVDAKGNLSVLAEPQVSHA